MSPQLEHYRNALAEAAYNPKAEKFVRILLEEVAKDCPLPILLQLGECLLNANIGERLASMESVSPGMAETSE